MNRAIAPVSRLSGVIRLLVAAAVAAGAFVPAACSSSSSSGSPSTSNNPFVGTWACTLTSNITISMPPGQPNKSDTSSGTYVLTDSSGTLTATEVVDGGAGGGQCPSVRYSVSGSQATLLPNQTCTLSGLAIQYTMGTSTVSGDMITSNLAFTASGSVVLDGGVSLQVAGSGTEAVTCTRM